MIRLEVNTNQIYDILLGHNIISNLKDYVDKNKQILIIFDTFHIYNWYIIIHNN